MPRRLNLVGIAKGEAKVYRGLYRRVAGVT